MTAEVVVFGRAPTVGAVKTRLAAAVGAPAAARVYRALLDHTLEAALASNLPVTLALTARLTGPWRPPAGVAIELQGPGDLGARMAATFAARFAAGASVVVLVGSDVPSLTAADIRIAADLAASFPVVLGPASDGGYWLVSQRAPGLDLFSDVPWSSPETLAATRQRLARLGASHTELAVRSDVDWATDLSATLAAGNLEPRLARSLRDALTGAPVSLDP
jgi:uncharacterized protein